MGRHIVMHNVYRYNKPIQTKTHSYSAKKYAVEQINFVKANETSSLDN